MTTDSTINLYKNYQIYLNVKSTLQILTEKKLLIFLGFKNSSKLLVHVAGCQRKNRVKTASILQKTIKYLLLMTK